MTDSKLPHEQAFAYARQLRKHGYAVVVFTPSELGGADPARLENHLVEQGNEFISDNQPAPKTAKGFAP